ncbi:Sterile alpha motif domain-containing protein 14 [Bagarius yarrelli]|uniref:Sterile alpha motif domain-containing protein 14 n=1 Tax=Bagarius yarrelli TaxID=175774 RepID=A0A556VVQ5_BAGYA|nr:Sterile alpha motif domain-containing protein 14 [Bagarius yarrelli]
MSLHPSGRDGRRDLTDAVPETERLDSSLQKAKAQLSIKTRRHRPSRSRLRDSLSSTEGDDSLDGKSCSGPMSGSRSPLHMPLRCPSPFSDLHSSSSSSSSPARKDRAFIFEMAEREKKVQRRRSACLLNSSSPTHLFKGDHLQQHKEDHAPTSQRAHHPQHQDDSLQLWQGDNLKRHNKENFHLGQDDRSDLHQDDHIAVHREEHTHLQQGGHMQLGQENPILPQQRKHLQKDLIYLQKRDHLQRDHTHLQLRDPLQEDLIHMQKRDHVQKDHTHLQKGDHRQNNDTHLQKRDHLREDLVHLQKKDHLQKDHVLLHQRDLQKDLIHLQKRDHLQKDDAHLQKRDHLRKDQTTLHNRDDFQTDQTQKDQEENHSPLHKREYSQSEDDARDIGSDEPSSPTVLLDKKTRRRFLDLGVTLRRTYGKVRRERVSRHAAENQEPDGAENRSTRSSGPPFVPFSWLAERIRGAGSPKNSSQSPAKSLAEDEELKNDSRSSRNESSQPYQSLSDHSDEGRDAEACIVKKKSILPFSSGGRDRTEKQNGVRRDKWDDGNDEDGQKLLTSQSQCKHLN